MSSTNSLLYQSLCIPSYTLAISNLHVSDPPLVLPSPVPLPRPNPLAHLNPPINNHSFFNVHDDSLLLSTHAKSHITQAIQGSWAESTLKRYTRTIKQFIHVSSRWIRSLRFGRHAGGTPRSCLSALKAWHATHNVEWKGSSRLCYVLNRVKNFAPGSSRRPPCPPVNSDMLVWLINSLDLSSPLDAAVAACAMMAFWGQCQLGELLPLSSSSLPPAALPLCSDFKRSLKKPYSCILRLPWTKTHHHGQDVVLVDQCPPINLISLLKNHIRVNGVRHDDFLFSFTSTTGWVVLSKKIFLCRCNTIWSALGYPRTTGHCFRIGGTTELLVASIPPDIVKATGRCSSESFLCYWRSLDDIAPHHIRNIHTFKCRRRHC